MSAAHPPFPVEDDDASSGAPANGEAASGGAKRVPSIPFSLSEGAFALFPPLEGHAASYPHLQPPLVEPTPLFSKDKDTLMRGEGLLPVERVRGDSYAAELSKLSLTPEQHQMSTLMLAAARSYPPPPHKFGPIVTVCSYTNFGDLAHGPRGVEARRAMRTYRLNLVDGSLTLLSAVREGHLHNPAFCRRHPSLPVLYACTESVKLDGQVAALALDGKNGALSEVCAPVSAGGTSTCYLTIHKACRRMLLVNYWDSTIVCLALRADGQLGAALSKYDPKGGKAMAISADAHVNHSLNDASAQAERQRDPHSHAIVLEPSMGVIAYVPDLGMDVIRQFHFDEPSGAITPCGVIGSGIKAGGRGLGPRYLTFAIDVPACYVVNELASQVAVFEYHPEVAAQIARTRASPAPDEHTIDTPTLTLIQTVSTVPEAFPPEMNTCGRVTIHPTGDFVVTSNRGHDSIAVHRVHRDSTPPGMLTLAGIFHTRGETPRHFQFDRSGQWLLVANQDSNTCAVFAFNTATGQITYTGNTYSCPSPNFVCVWDGV